MIVDWTCLYHQPQYGETFCRSRLSRSLLMVIMIDFFRSLLHFNQIFYSLKKGQKFNCKLINRWMSSSFTHRAARSVLFTNKTMFVVNTSKYVQQELGKKWRVIKLPKIYTYGCIYKYTDICIYRQVYKREDLYTIM